MYKHIIFLFSLFLVFQSEVNAQSELIISLEQAIEIALTNDPSLRASELQRFQNEELSKGSVAVPRSQISLSGDEFNLNGQTGIQSLNVQQNFNHPSVAKSYASLYGVKALKFERIQLLNKKEITWHVESAYYRLVFAKQYVVLSRELQSVYKDFYQLAEKAFESGETNKLPLLSANTLQKKSNLMMNHASHEVEEAKEILNIWLGGDKRYDTSEIDFNFKPEAVIQLDNNNPHLNIYEIEKSIVLKSIDIQKAMLLPQFITGLSLQSINGDVLFFGYQAGLSIPLFRKAVNNKLRAHKINLDIQTEMMNGKKKKMMLEISRINNHIEHLISKVEYFDKELLPAAVEEKNLLKEAYKAGEVGYLEYMLALDNYKQFQLERIELMQDYFVSLAELNYWTNNPLK